MAGTKVVSQGKRFRNLSEAPEILVMPGAWDGLSARLIEQAGFDGVYKCLSKNVFMSTVKFRHVVGCGSMIVFQDEAR